MCGTSPGVWWYGLQVKGYLSRVTTVNTALMAFEGLDLTFGLACFQSSTECKVCETPET